MCVCVCVCVCVCKHMRYEGNKACGVVNVKHYNITSVNKTTIDKQPLPSFSSIVLQ